MMPLRLVCVRHGESAWNKDNKFCGWVDVPLSVNGLQEAKQAAKAIQTEKLMFDTIYTSILTKPKLEIFFDYNGNESCKGGV